MRSIRLSSEEYPRNSPPSTGFYLTQIDCFRMEATTNIRIAVFQGTSVDSDIEQNINQVRKFAAKAAASGCDLLVFPELFLSGYDIGIDNLRACAVPSDSGSMQVIAELAKSHSIALVVPYAERGQDGRCYNSAALFGRNGELVLNYRKCHLF